MHITKIYVTQRMLELLFYLYLTSAQIVTLLALPIMRRHF